MPSHLCRKGLAGQMLGARPLLRGGVWDQVCSQAVFVEERLKIGAGLEGTGACPLQPLPEVAWHGGRF